MKPEQQFKERDYRDYGVFKKSTRMLSFELTTIADIGMIGEKRFSIVPFATFTALLSLVVFHLCGLHLAAFSGRSGREGKPWW
jgi:hypothetical protein